MNKSQAHYISGQIILLVIGSAALYTGHVWYMIGFGACAIYFGIGREQTTYKKLLSNKYIQILVLIYYALLCVLLLVKFELVRETEEPSLFIVIFLPFIPMIIYSEVCAYRKLAENSKTVGRNN